MIQLICENIKKEYIMDKVKKNVYEAYEKIAELYDKELLDK